MKHVKATGLSSVFDGLNPVIFTDEAKNKGVTNNSIIYIKCEEGDDDKYGEQFVPGSTWIWAQGEWFAKDTRPITSTEIDEIVLGEEVGNDWEQNLTITAHKLRAIKKVVLEGAGSYTINPNEYNILNGLDYDVIINKGDEIDPSVVNVYSIRCIIAPGLATVPSVEFSGWDDLKWYGGAFPTMVSGAIYEITILDNIALWTEVQ